MHRVCKREILNKELRIPVAYLYAISAYITATDVNNRNPQLNSHKSVVKYNSCYRDMSRPILSSI